MTVIINDLKSLCDDVLRCITTVGVVLDAFPDKSECERPNIKYATEYLEKAEVFLECASRYFVKEIGELGEMER